MLVLIVLTLQRGRPCFTRQYLPRYYLGIDTRYSLTVGHVLCRRTRIRFPRETGIMLPLPARLLGNARDCMRPSIDRFIPGEIRSLSVCLMPTSFSRIRCSESRSVLPGRAMSVAPLTPMETAYISTPRFRGLLVGR